jgi:hypothetical protein
MGGGQGCARPVIDRLSAYNDGELSTAERAAIRAHLDGCAWCARAAGEMAAMVGAARTLDRPEPPPTLWSAIEGRMARMGGQEARPRRWFPAWLFGTGALAGAAAALIVVVGVRGGARRPEALPPVAPPVAAAVVDPLLQEAEAEFAQAAAAYERSIEKLRGILAREERRWSPDERARCAERLARLDDAIDRSRAATRQSPGDDAGNEQLFAAYQQKIAFLTAAVHRGGARGEGMPR